LHTDHISTVFCNRTLFDIAIVDLSNIMSILADIADIVRDE